MFTRHLTPQTGKRRFSRMGATAMFRNGIYKVYFRNPTHNEGSGELAVIVVRDGQITGSDRLGAVLTGTAGSDRNSLQTVQVELDVPPGGELITGFRAGPAGAKLNIDARLDPEKLCQIAMIDVGGQPVEITVDYLGLMPE
jgi:hypothetical protein